MNAQDLTALPRLAATALSEQGVTGTGPLHGPRLAAVFGGTEMQVPQHLQDRAIPIDRLGPSLQVDMLPLAGDPSRATTRRAFSGEAF